MAEIMGYLVCTHKGCHQVAQLKADKRKKFFVNCPKHGRHPYSTNVGQEYLKSLISDGRVFGSEEDAKYYYFENTPTGLEVMMNDEVIKPETEIEETGDHDIEKKESGAGKKTGLLFLMIGVIAGGVIWLKKP